MGGGEVGQNLKKEGRQTMQGGKGVFIKQGEGQDPSVNYDMEYLYIHILLQIHCYIKYFYKCIYICIYIYIIYDIYIIYIYILCKTYILLIQYISIYLDFSEAQMSYEMWTSDAPFLCRSVCLFDHRLPICIYIYIYIIYTYIYIYLVYVKMHCPIKFHD